MIDHIDFGVVDFEISRKFYSTVLGALGVGGGCKGAPGLRPDYGEHYYAAFVIDPDGHTIEAVWRVAE